MDSNSTPPYSSLIETQTITHIPSFHLESGSILRNVPVAYKTWGTLNDRGDNVMVICHAFTGSADVEDWWGPLMGPGKAFDPTRFFIFCGNVMGSPYGSASPLTLDDDTGHLFGPEFPSTTIRDDVRLHKIVLDSLGITSVAVAIGGSMGGMAVLEWPLCSPPGYIRNIIPIATSARHSAWCISWGEAQRQSIYSDPAYKDGYYHPVTGQPKTGLGAARMAALLTYRSRDSFESRFGRKPQTGNNDETITPPDSPPRSQADEALALHNDGHRNGSGARSPRSTTPSSPAAISRTLSFPANNSSFPRTPKVFSAQSYLRYQGDKFTARFDANCYIHITRKMDTHDIARGRTPPSPVNTSDSTNQALISILRTLPSHALVISIQTDGLFTPSEQKEIASHIPHAKLVTIPSPEGHDGFLLEFEQMNKHILGHLRERLPGVYEKAVGMGKVEVSSESFVAKKTSVFGEAEVGVTTW